MTSPRTVDSPEESASPTAKAYLTVDLTPLGSEKGVGIPGNSAHTLTHKIIDFGNTLQGGTAPALTIYVGKGYLSPMECLIVIGIQFATIVILARRAGQAIRLHTRKV